MKKLFNVVAGAFLLVMLCLPGNAAAQYFNHLGVGVGVGTNGVSIELSSPVFSPWINLRAGVDIVPGITFSAEADAAVNANSETYSCVDLDAKLGRTQGHMIFDINPIPGARAFHVSVGAYFAGNKLVKLNGYSQELVSMSAQSGQPAGVLIGDMFVPSDGKGNIDGSLKVKGFRPYLGIGWGNALPGRRINFAIDLGIQFEGKPEVCSEFGTVTTSKYDDDNAFAKVRKYAKLYPVLAFRLNFRAL